MERSDILALMIERRHLKLSLPSKVSDAAVEFISGGKTSRIPESVLGRSLLWSPPEEYFVFDKWLAAKDAQLSTAANLHLEGPNKYKFE